MICDYMNTTSIIIRNRKVYSSYQNVFIIRKFYNSTDNNSNIYDNSSLQLVRYLVPINMCLCDGGIPDKISNGSEMAS